MKKKSVKLSSGLPQDRDSGQQKKAETHGKVLQISSLQISPGLLVWWTVFITQKISKSHKDLLERPPRALLPERRCVPLLYSHKSHLWGLTWYECFCDWPLTSGSQEALCGRSFEGSQKAEAQSRWYGVYQALCWVCCTVSSRSIWPCFSVPQPDKMAKALRYLEAALSFTESAEAMQTEPQTPKSSYTMFSETVDLIRWETC